MATPATLEGSAVVVHVREKVRDWRLAAMDPAYVAFVVYSQRAAQAGAPLTRLRGLGGVVRLIGDFAGLRALQTCCVCGRGALETDALVRSCRCEMAPYVHLACAADEIAKQPVCKACGEPWPSRMLPAVSRCRVVLGWLRALLGWLPVFFKWALCSLPLALLVLEQAAVAGTLFPGVDLPACQWRALPLVAGHRLLLLLVQALAPRRIRARSRSAVVQHVAVWWHVLLEVVTHFTLRTHRVESHHASPVEALLFLTVSLSVTPAAMLAYQWSLCHPCTLVDDDDGGERQGAANAALFVQPAWVAIWLDAAWSDGAGFHIWVVTQLLALLAWLCFFWRPAPPGTGFWLGSDQELEDPKTGPCCFRLPCLARRARRRLDRCQWCFSVSFLYVVWQAALVGWLWLALGFAYLQESHVYPDPIWASLLQLALIGAIAPTWICVCASIHSSSTVRPVFIPPR